MNTTTIRKSQTLLTETLTKLKQQFVKAKNGDNMGPFLAEIFVWQEVRKHADEMLKDTWKQVQAEGIIANDEALRALGKGEHIVAESDKYSCLITVDKPRDKFDRTDFIAEVAKKYKIKPSELQALERDCMGETSAPLTKRIIEV